MLLDSCTCIHIRHVCSKYPVLQCIKIVVFSFVSCHSASMDSLITTVSAVLHSPFIRHQYSRRTRTQLIQLPKSREILLLLAYSQSQMFIFLSSIALKKVLLIQLGRMKAVWPTYGSTCFKNAWVSKQNFWGQSKNRPVILVCI